jgi:hypothetical protein
MLARASRLNAANNVGAPCYGLFSIRCCLLAGETLEDDASVGTDLEIGNGIVVATSSGRRGKCCSVSYVGTMASGLSAYASTQAA